ncbi:MAG: protein translocase subunit SecF, partial [Spirochaetaceae bacterium]|nr:protein translocase subunit SecF [Spirochaetaceae bacterium]
MRIIRFSRGFVPAGILSLILIAAGVAGYVIKGGFNLGVDFQAGLIQEVQFAPAALRLRYAGPGNATLSLDRLGLSVVVTGVGVEGTTYRFPYAEYRDMGALRAALAETVEGLEAEAAEGEDIDGSPSNLLIQSTQGDPLLGAEPYVLHYLPADYPELPIGEVREALADLGTVSVQVLGQSRERRFMIRIEDREQEGPVPAGRIISALEDRFGAGEVAVTRSDYVGSRFSKQLTDQAGYLMALTLLLILIYASIRFKPQFALGAVLAIAHDALIMVGFITWTGMEFNTTTIAAILTILGYSINDTIVIFDRIRETRRIYPDEDFAGILDRSLTETLSRTIITTVTTMLAVISLYIFTTRALYQAGLPLGEKLAAIFTEHSNMKDFALALLAGMVSGVYSTIFIASGVASFWEKA